MIILGAHKPGSFGLIPGKEFQFNISQEQRTRYEAQAKSRKSISCGRASFLGIVRENNAVSSGG
jgi:hypothetical protein